MINLGDIHPRDVMPVVDGVALVGCGIACLLWRRASKARDKAEAKLRAIVDERRTRRRPGGPVLTQRPVLLPDAPTRVYRVPEQLPERIEDAATIIVPSTVDATRLDIAQWRVPTVDEMRGWTRHTATGSNWADAGTDGSER